LKAKYQKKMNRMYKFLFILIVSTFLFTEIITAQTELDGLRYSQKYAGGDARFMAMSGAFGALGGNLSAININPASVGLFRSNQFSFSPEMIFDESKVDFLAGSQTTMNNFNKFTISNLGYATSYLTGNTEGLTSINFSITYNKVADFNQYYTISGVNRESSMAQAFVYYSNGTEPENLWNYIDRLAFDTYVIDTDGSNTNYIAGLNIYDLNQTQTKSKKTVGGMNEFDISLGASYSNKVYIGGSIGITAINYNETSSYSELNNNADTNFYNVKYFELNESLWASGVGMNIKVGAIFRPMNWFRLGISLHSGSFIAMSEQYDTNMESEVHYISENGTVEGPGFIPYSASPTDIDGYELGALVSDYYIKSPAKAIASLAFVIDKMAMISIDYERTNYSKITMDAFDYELDDINTIIQENYKATNVLRLGLELKTGPFALRGGVSYYESAYKSEDFVLDPTKLSYSAGAGIDKGNLYFDFAYSVFKSNTTDYFYTVPDSYSTSGATKDSKKSKAIATIGFRF